MLTRSLEKHININIIICMQEEKKKIKEIHALRPDFLLTKPNSCE